LPFVGLPSKLTLTHCVTCAGSGAARKRTAAKIVERARGELMSVLFGERPDGASGAAG
jgi:hypothetical protein